MVNAFTKLSLLLASATALVAATPLVERTDSLPTYPIGINGATWDGEFAYPKPIDNFKASKYVGPKPDGDSRSVWYQWAASEQPFLTGCDCVYARYGTNNNGSVSVENFCRRGGAGEAQSGIKGFAEPTPDFGEGSFQVAFFGRKPDQKGPNYVVTRAFTNKPGESKVRVGNAGQNPKTKGKPNAPGQYETVVVGSQDFDGWFLLSRTREVRRSVVEDYLREVADAGFDLSKKYSIYNQSGCGAEPKYSPAH